MGIKELCADDLYVHAVNEDFEHTSIKNIEPTDEIVGRKYAQKAVE